MINQNYVYGLELGIKELAAERDAALAQNAELVAQVESLRSASVKAVNFIENGVEFGFIRMPDADCPDPAHYTLPALHAALSATPAQCLRQIQATAGRLGFIDGYSQAQSDPFTANDTEIELYADEYAERVKAGEL